MFYFRLYVFLKFLFISEKIIWEKEKKKRRKKYREAML